MSRKSLSQIEELEFHYLNKYYHFLKFAEDELLAGFRTKEDIKQDWFGLIYYSFNLTQEGEYY